MFTHQKVKEDVHSPTFELERTPFPTKSTDDSFIPNDRPSDYEESFNQCRTKRV